MEVFMYYEYLLKLEEAGEIRNLKERSIYCYKNYISYFLNYVKKNPEELTCQDVTAFILAKKKEGLKSTTLNLYNSAIRFFYRNVLHILWDDITVPRMIIDHKLPTVLTPEEVDQLLNATDDLKYKAMFATMYSSGMRVSEVIHLHYDDISRTNMQIHVRYTKNRMDRYTILSKRNLEILTKFWYKKGKPRGILFPIHTSIQLCSVVDLMLRTIGKIKVTVFFFLCRLFPKCSVESTWTN